jgi:large subunit ribosomal protein L25
MPDMVVAAESRSKTGKNENRRLRAAEKIPGILYGSGKETTAVAVSPKAIAAILRSASGENTIFDLDLEGTKRKVILKEYQVEPVRSRLLHADFFEIALDKELQVEVHVELSGTPVGVKQQGGVIDFVTRELEISCLPADIPAKIVVDVSALEIGKHLRVSDLQLPPKVKVLTDADIVVVHVVAPRAEEAAPAAEAAAATEGAAEPEVIKKGKGEEADEKGEKGDKAEKKEKK